MSLRTPKYNKPKGKVKKNLQDKTRLADNLPDTYFSALKRFDRRDL